MPQEDQRTLDALKIQSDYLVTEVNGIKETLKDFMTEVRDKMDELSERISDIQITHEN